MALRLIPLPHECPRDFCFNWSPVGTWEAPGVHDSREAALAESFSRPPSTVARCGWSLGVCTRLRPDGDDDFYERHEPNLERAGLPEDYFSRQLK